jgi:hypothetical protein
MGGKQSKESVDMSSPKYNIYDKFNNNTDTDPNNTDYIKEYINPYFYVYSVIMAIVLVYSIVFYTSIYIRRYYISNSRVK